MSFTWHHTPLFSSLTDKWATHVRSSSSSDLRDEALEERRRRCWLLADLAACCRVASYRKPAATKCRLFVESCAKGEEGLEGRVARRSGEAPPRPVGGEEGPRTDRQGGLGRRCRIFAGRWSPGHA
jgi:hypothetical protein